MGAGLPRSAQRCSQFACFALKWLQPSTRLRSCCPKICLWLSLSPMAWTVQSVLPACGSVQCICLCVCDSRQDREANEPWLFFCYGVCLCPLGSQWDATRSTSTSSVITYGILWRWLTEHGVEGDDSAAGQPYSTANAACVLTHVIVVGGGLKPTHVMFVLPVDPTLQEKEQFNK